MTAKKVLLLTISAAAVFAAFFGIKTILAAPTCGTGGVCSVLTTDGSGNFGIGANSDGVSNLYIKTVDHSASYNGLKIVSNDGVSPVFVVRNDGLVTMASSTSFANAGLVFPDGSKQVTAFTGSASAITAGNVSAGSFGSNLGGGVYSFPAALAVGTTTTTGLPTNGLYVGGNVGIGTVAPVSKFHVQRSDSGCGAQCFSDAAIFENNGNSYVQIMGSNAGEKALNFGSPANGADGAIKYNNPAIPNGLLFAAGGNTTRMVINSSGNVGIATTTPGYPLTVAGTIYSSSGGYRFPDGTTQTTAATAGTNYFTLSGSNLYPTSTTYNLGVGTTTPASKITAVGDIRAVGSLIALSSGNGLSVRDINGSPRVDTNLNSGNGELSIYNSGANKTVYLSSNGNSYLTGGTLNVGTATPTTGYRISTLDGGIYVGSNDQGGHPAAFFNSNNSGVAVYVNALNSDGGYLGAAGMYSSMEFGLYGSNDEVIALYDQSNQKYHYGWALTVDSASGNVGVGTDSPAAKLDVASGNVRLGNGTLYVYKASPADAVISLSSGAANEAMTAGWSNGGFAYIQGGSWGGTTKSLILQGGGGYVGINTASATYPLTVAGTIYSSSGGFRFPDGTTQTTAATGGGSNYFALNGTSLYPTSTSYNVGIGTTTPAYPLVISSTNANPIMMGVTGSAASPVSIAIGRTAAEGRLGISHASGAFATDAAAGDLVIRTETSTNSVRILAGTGATVLQVTSSTVSVVGGTGKINVGTIDPPYTINGEQYATYMSAMTGQKEETTGELTLICHSELDSESSGSCGKTIDFNTQEKGSDLWLFAKTTNLAKQMNKMTVLLTPSFDGKVWYEKDATNNVLKIFASPLTGDKSLVDSYSVSYRLTAPRFDADRWTNTRNEKGVPGLIINY